MDLRSIDVPETAQIAADTDLTVAISAVRISKPRTVLPTVTVREAIDAMKDDPMAAVAVVDAGKVVGIFTERDVLKKIAAHPKLLAEPVSSHMTPDPVILREDDTMAYAHNKMGDGGFRHIPVVQNGNLIGMLSGRDIMAWMLGRYFD
jgi:CBS domain-containing protein